MDLFTNCVIWKRNLQNRLLKCIKLKNLNAFSVKLIDFHFLKIFLSKKTLEHTHTHYAIQFFNLDKV